MISANIHCQTLNKIHLMDFNANRRYLLEKTQHMIGGFGKMAGDPPGKPAISFLSMEMVLVMQQDRFPVLALCLQVYYWAEPSLLRKGQTPGLRDMMQISCTRISAWLH